MGCYVTSVLVVSAPETCMPTTEVSTLFVCTNKDKDSCEKCCLHNLCKIVHNFLRDLNTELVNMLHLAKIAIGRLLGKKTNSWVGNCKTYHRL